MIDVADIMNAVDAKRQEVGFEELNEPERVISCVSYARFEIELGGFSSFYYNSAGDYASETVWALKKIGAHKTADIVQRANSLFPRRKPPRDREERFEELDLIREKLGLLDTEFYQEPDDLSCLLRSFITENRKQLPTVSKE